jgi:hypothetical protein
MDNDIFQMARLGEATELGVLARSSYATRKS